MFIDSKEDLNQYKTFCAGQPIYVVPLLESQKQHFVKNNIIAFYVKCNTEEFVFPYKHPESIFNEYSINDVVDNTTCYFYNKPVLNYTNQANSDIRDVELLHYLNTVEPLDIENLQTDYFYDKIYVRFTKTNNLVSISNFVKYSRAIIAQANLTTEHGSHFYDRMLTLFSNKIERNGIAVDKNLFTALYGAPINLVDGRIYTKYNFFTTTGRPSNRFGGINFAALNKQDDTRKCFISRYDGGKLVELDFKAYHPRIIAYLCGYDFGTQDVYEHLAQYYFDTKQPTKEQIGQAKELTFNQVYGGINRKYLNIEFFAKAKDYTTTLWKLYKEQGYIESELSGRRFFVTDDEDMTEAKLFNYFIQMTETELNYLYLSKVFNEIDSEEALPVLYTYDAVVFDCKKEYVDRLIEKLFHMTTEKFPISVKIGDNYKEMIKFPYEATTTVHIHG